MAIHTVEQIQINGSNKAFGGYIYSVRYNISYGESPSTLQLSLISEDGKYDINSSILNNTYCAPYHISIGSQISLDMYLDTIDITISPAGNILNLGFSDTSRILDIINVGLYKRHGINSKPNLIIVGKEINPCADDPYGNPPPNTFFDPCHPCLKSQGQNTQANYVDCVEKAKYEILDVKYNFSDLIAKIPIKIRGGTNPNPKYLTQHTGTLREVLNAWCQDFGWFFYWSNGTIVFKDLRNTIQVAANIENFCPNVLEYSTSYSMKDSVKTATITNFTRPGDPARKYDCQEAKYLIATSLTQNSSFTMPLTISPEIDRIAAGLSYYSEDLRNLYYFYQKYQMYNQSNFTQGKKLDKLGMTILSAPITVSSLSSSPKPIDDVAIPSEVNNISSDASSIDPFSEENSGILSTAQATNVATIIANTDYYECVKLLDFETQWKIITNPGNYFFFFASHNQEIEKSYLREEQEYAGFLNKYAIYVPDPTDLFFEDYDFQVQNLCGINYFVDTGNISYNFLGDGAGNIHFYNTSERGNAAGQGAGIGELPFSKFLSTVRDSTNRQNNSSNYFIPFKLILVERGRNTYIPDGPTQSNGSYPAIRDYTLLDQISKYLPYKVANKTTIRGEYLSRILSSVSSNNTKIGDISLFLGRVTGIDDFRVTERDDYNNLASFGTLFDGKPINQESDPALQNQPIIYQYPDLKCKILGNHSYNSPTSLHANKIVFKTPLASFEYTEPTDALFGMVIEKTTKKRRIIKKVETFNSNLSADTCNFAKLVVNYHNISDDTLRVLKKNNKVCEFNQQTIQNIHTQFSNNLALNYIQPTISKTFKIAGIELNGYTPTIDNGLISLQIGLDSSNAIYSIYEFGTRLMKLPSTTAINYNNDVSIPRGSYTNTVNYFPLVGQPNV